VRRYHSKYEGYGHVWRGRFKAFPVQPDEHLTGLLRFVESNPLRSQLVKRAEDWRWSSLAHRGPKAESEVLAPSPAKLPDRWTALVNRPQREAEMQAIVHSIRRGTPLGSERWTAATVKRLGLESTVRPRGRPRKT